MKLMLILFILFILLLVLIFFLAKALTQSLYRLFYSLTRDQERAVHLLTWLLLPGTVVHELSHLLVAEVLRVPTGELTFTPEIRENNQIRAGGLKMAKTDPLRHSLIGLAPTLVGITTITAVMHFIFIPLLQKTFSLSFRPSHYQAYIINFLLLFALSFLLFALSNTMFSSKKDLETILFPILILTILAVGVGLGGIKINLPVNVIDFINQALKSLDYALLGTAIIDLAFLLIIKGFLQQAKKIPQPSI